MTQPYNRAFAELPAHPGIYDLAQAAVMAVNAYLFDRAAPGYARTDRDQRIRTTETPTYQLEVCVDKDCVFDWQQFLDIIAELVKPIIGIIKFDHEGIFA